MRGTIICNHNWRQGRMNVTVHEAVGANRTLQRRTRVFTVDGFPGGCPAFRRYMVRLFRLGLGESCCYRDQYWVPADLREIGLAKRGWITDV